jgi:hypothetical protein
VVEVFDPPFWPLPFASPVPLPVPPLPDFLKPAGTRRGSLGEGQRRYALTPLGALLRADAVGSMRPWAVFAGTELGAAWGGLLTAVRTGQPDFAGSQKRRGSSDSSSRSDSGSSRDSSSSGSSFGSSGSSSDTGGAAVAAPRGSGEDRGRCTPFS